MHSYDWLRQVLDYKGNHIITLACKLITASIASLITLNLNQQKKSRHIRFYAFIMCLLFLFVIRVWA